MEYFNNTLKLLHYIHFTGRVTDRVPPTSFYSTDYESMTLESPCSQWNPFPTTA